MNSRIDQEELARYWCRLARKNAVHANALADEIDDLKVRLAVAEKANAALFEQHKKDVNEFIEASHSLAIERDEWRAKAAKSDARAERYKARALGAEPKLDLLVGYIAHRTPYPEGRYRDPPMVSDAIRMFDYTLAKAEKWRAECLRLQGRAYYADHYEAERDMLLAAWEAAVRGKRRACGSS